VTILTVGIDLAKNVFAVHDVGETGKAELPRPSAARATLLNLSPDTNSPEHCLCLAKGRAAGQARPAKGAICQAIQRPHMRFVPLKDMEQQSRLTVHRACQGFVGSGLSATTRMLP